MTHAQLPKVGDNVSHRHGVTNPKPHDQTFSLIRSAVCCSVDPLHIFIVNFTTVVVSVLRYGVERVIDS